MNRRSFVHSAGGLVAGALCAPLSSPVRQPFVSLSRPRWAKEYERIVRSSEWLPYVGIPNDWETVHQGLHPFSPERIAIQRPPYGVANSRKRRVLERCVGWREDFRAHGWPTISDEKTDVILSLMDVVARYYPAQDVFETWAKGLVCREDLGSTGIGRHWGIVHQFQGKTGGAVKSSERVDWWLFLFPQGAEYDALDDKPVHALFGLVMADDTGRAHFEMHVLSLFSQVLRIDDSQAVFQLSAIDAARVLNQRLGHTLSRLAAEGERPWPKRQLRVAT